MIYTTYTTRYTSTRFIFGREPTDYFRTGKTGEIGDVQFRQGSETVIRNEVSLPHNEVLTERQVRKPQYLCGFRDFPNRINLPLYTKFTPIGAKNGAETKKSHNLRNEWAVP